MIFLVGTRDTNIKNGIISNEKCPKCEEENTLHFSIYRKYTHLTTIPLFPVGKSVFINCDNCDACFDYADLNQNCQEKLANEKLSNSFWLFSGSIIIFLFLAFAIKDYIVDNDKTKVLIKNPIEGDVYNLKFSNGYYSSMRVDKVTKDSIFTTHNDLNAYLPYEVDDLDKTENYSDKKVSYTREELIRLYNDEEIIKIRRSRYTIEN